MFKQRKFKMKGLAGLLLASVIFTVFWVSTKAVSVNVNKLDGVQYIVDENPLLLERWIGGKTYDAPIIDTMGNSQITVKDGNDFGSSDAIKQINIPKSIINSSGVSVKITYPNVGYYSGRRIGAKVTQTVTDYADVYESTYAGTAILVYPAFTRGFRFYNAKNMKYSIEYYYMDDNSTVNVQNAVYTFNSMNFYDNLPADSRYGTRNDESVYFYEEMANRISEVYIMKNNNSVADADSNIAVITGTNEGLKGKYSLGLVPISEEGFVDNGRNISFIKNSASIKYSGTKLEYVFDSRLQEALHAGSMWHTPSSAPITGEKPKPPVKYVDDLNGTRKNKAEFNVGETVVFEVDQKVNTLNEDIQVNYTSFKMEDILPEEVDYVSAKMYKGSEEITGGTINYDSSSRKVTWTASNDFLSSMDLQGETYTLKITTTTNSKFTKATKNKATTIINDNSQVSNEVEITPFDPTAPTKAVSQEDITNIVKAKGTYKYTVKQEVQATNGRKYSSMVMKDTLEKVLTPTAVVVKDETGADRTSYFTADINGQVVTVTANAQALSNNAFYGHTYSYIIDAKVKEGLKDSDVASYRNGTVYKVPNKATVTIDSSSKTTNTVYVYWYRGMCPGGDCSNCEGDNCTEPQLKPVKTVSTNYINEITTFEYRVSQYVPGYNANYLWTDLTLTDTIDKAYDMSHTSVKILDLKYANKDVTDDYFDITKNDHTITAKAKASALTNANFYSDNRYEMVITTKVTDGFKFTGYTQEEKNCTTTNGKKECESVYTIINNQASRTFKDKHANTYTAQTNKIPTTEVNIGMPVKKLDYNTDVVRPGKEFKYSITKEIQPATSDNYYKEFVFTDELEAPLKIEDASKVKITQITASGTTKDYTDKFTINVNGNKVTATLKNPKDSDFYGTRKSNNEEQTKKYKFTLTVSMREDAFKKVDMSKYLDTNQSRYVIPNIAKFSIKNRDSKTKTETTNEVKVYYYPEPEPVKNVSEEDITNIYKNKGTFTFEITKDVLEYDSKVFYESFVMKDELEDCLEAKEVIVKNETGQNVTEWFDTKISGQTVASTLKNDYNKKEFYGHTYTFMIVTKVKEGYDLGKWRIDDYYVIPNEAEIIIDNNIKLKTNEKKVRIKIDPGKVIVPPTSANVSQILATVGITFIITSAGYLFYMNNGKKLFKKN